MWHLLWEQNDTKNMFWYRTQIPFQCFQWVQWNWYHYITWRVSRTDTTTKMKCQRFIGWQGSGEGVVAGLGMMEVAGIRVGVFRWIRGRRWGRRHNCRFIFFMPSFKITVAQFPSVSTELVTREVRCGAKTMGHWPFFNVRRLSASKPNHNGVECIFFIFPFRQC